MVPFPTGGQTLQRATNREHHFWYRFTRGRTQLGTTFFKILSATGGLYTLNRLYLIAVSFRDIGIVLSVRYSLPTAKRNSQVASTGARQITSLPMWMWACEGLHVPTACRASTALCREL